MNKTVIFLIIILILWIAGTSYFYVCQIRDNCKLKSDVELNQDEKKLLESDSSPELQTGISPDTSGLQLALADTAGIKTILNDSAMVTDSIRGIEDVIPLVDKKIIYFDFNSVDTEMDAATLDYFKELRVFLNNNPNRKIYISGHSDDVGPENGKLIISLKRAEFIKKQLISDGVSEKQIEIDSKSDTEPIASNQTKTGRSQNRRVEILIKK